MKKYQHLLNYVVRHTRKKRRNYLHIIHKYFITKALHTKHSRSVKLGQRGMIRR